MRSWRNALATLALGSATLVGACSKGRDATTNNASGDVAAQPGSSAATTPSSNASGTNTATTRADSTQTRHHSKLAGAAVGAAAGHVLGGHAVAGAAAGALVQHARNKSNKP
ncbi:MAG TPA: hypothetical protein VGP25_18465 [Gemmatimonadaceae bacterium]|nr:hypothetical protein [Gemmatimonadaceae bacterium]